MKTKQKVVTADDKPSVQEPEPKPAKIEEPKKHSQKKPRRRLIGLLGR